MRNLIWILWPFLLAAPPMFANAADNHSINLPHDIKADTAAILKWIIHANGCDNTDDYPNPDTEINALEYFDFNHDGQDELVVTASTCNTGTAGPDIHSVFFRNPDGTFTEYPLPDVDKKYFRNMVCNCNFDMSLRDGMIIANWHDRSNRPLPPLAVSYAWNGHGFIPLTIVAPYMNQPPH